MEDQEKVVPNVEELKEQLESIKAEKENLLSTKEEIEKLQSELAKQKAELEELKQYKFPTEKANIEVKDEFEIIKEDYDNLLSGKVDRIINPFNPANRESPIFLDNYFKYKALPPEQRNLDSIKNIYEKEKEYNYGG